MRRRAEPRRVARRNAPSFLRSVSSWSLSSDGFGCVTEGPPARLDADRPLAFVNPLEDQHRHIAVDQLLARLRRVYEHAYPDDLGLALPHEVIHTPGRAAAPEEVVDEEGACAGRDRPQRQGHRLNGSGRA